MGGMAHDLLLLVALIGFGALAVIDFRTLKVRNQHVLWMLALALAALALRGRGVWVPDLVAGLVLFGLGFVFWMLGMMGAGDAKLYLPLGILIGWQGLALFAVLLLGASLLLLLLIRTGPHWLPQGAFHARVAELSEGRNLPYAVPMALAAMGTILLRWL